VENWTGTILEIGIPVTLLLLGYFVGGSIERRHYASIRARELLWAELPAVTFRNVPDGWTVDDSTLLSGNVVISVDYFKRFLASLRALFGGRVKSYESLMDRGRREALVRLKAETAERGFHALVNVRLETSRMASARGGRGVAGIEVLAYGTALKLRNRTA
jgi:uncharacterized protein YbjQ (UPF0145 family)